MGSHDETQQGLVRNDPLVAFALLVLTIATRSKSPFNRFFSSAAAAVFALPVWLPSLIERI